MDDILAGFDDIMGEIDLTLSEELLPISRQNSTLVSVVVVAAAVTVVVSVLANGLEFAVVHL